jgi:hypothetical protein
MQREFRPGDVVLLLPDPASVAYVPGLAEYSERQLHITRIVYASSMPRTNGKGIVYLELEGCASKYGVPYGILREWVFPVRSYGDV